MTFKYKGITIHFIEPVGRRTAIKAVERTLALNLPRKTHWWG
jgi:hypothetical protein